MIVYHGFYLNHPILSKRLFDTTQALLQLTTNDAEKVMGYVDALKLKSSMTLFHRVDPNCELFSDVLKKFFNGEEDWKTLSIFELAK